MVEIKSWKKLKGRTEWNNNNKIIWISLYMRNQFGDLTYVANIYYDREIKEQLGLPSGVTKSKAITLAKKYMER